MTVARGTTSTDNAARERSLVLTFDGFGRTALAALAKRDGVPIPEYVTACCLTYAERLENEAFSLRVPRFKPPDGEPYELRLALPAHVWQTLEGDAARQGIPIEQLIEHAAISGLARDPERPETPADDATASRARRLPRRRIAAASLVAVVLGVPLLTAGLAIGGVTLPDAARAPFEAVGIKLPNQPNDPPEKPAESSGASAAPSESAGPGGGGEAHRAHRQDSGKPDRGGDGGNGRGDDGGPVGGGDAAAADQGQEPAVTSPGGSTQPPGGAPEPPPSGIGGVTRTLEERIRDVLDHVGGLREVLPLPDQ